MPTECEKQNRASARHAESIDGNEHATTMTVAPSVSSEKKKKMEDSEAGVVAESETPAAEEPPPSMPAPPNGGLAAWLQVSGAFWIYFNTWGLIMTFGVFQTYYETHLLASLSPSSISWVGTAQVFLLVEVGILVGPLFDRGHMRPLAASGAALLVLGLLTASLARHYYSVFLSLGVCAGVGMGLLFFPAVSGLAMYFSTRRGLANGVAASGSALGAVIYPIVLRQLIHQVSFPWAVRVVGFIVLATNLIPLAIMKPLFLPKNKRKLMDLSIFKDLVYATFALSNAIGRLGVQIPLFYAGPFATQSLHLPESQSFYVLALLGAGSLPGRLLAPLAGDRLGPLAVYPAFMALGGAPALAWPYAVVVVATGTSSSSSWPPSLVVLSLFYGFAYGGVVSLPPPAVAAMTRDVRVLGARIGAAFSFAGLSALVGPPIAGAIARGGDRAGFENLFAFAGATMLAGSACLAGVAWLHAREEVRTKRKAGGRGST